MAITKVEVKRFISQHLKDREPLPDEASIDSLVYNINVYGITYNQLESYWKRFKNSIPMLEREYIQEFADYDPKFKSTGKLWRVDGLISILMDLGNDSHWEDSKKYMPFSITHIMEVTRKRLA